MQPTVIDCCFLRKYRGTYLQRLRSEQSSPLFCVDWWPRPQPRRTGPGLMDRRIRPTDLRVGLRIIFCAPVRATVVAALPPIGLRSKLSADHKTNAWTRRSGPALHSKTENRVLSVFFGCFSLVFCLLLPIPTRTAARRGNEFKLVADVAVETITTRCTSPCCENTSLLYRRKKCVYTRLTKGYSLVVKSYASRYIGY
jgi:hypothetical protein